MRLKAKFLVYLLRTFQGSVGRVDKSWANTYLQKEVASGGRD